MTVDPNVCQLHKAHTPKPLVIVKHHIVPLGCGGPDVPENWAYVCDTGHRNLHTLMGPAFNGHPMPKGGSRTERALARLAYTEWVALGSPGSPHAAYGAVHDPSADPGHAPT